MKKYLLLLLLSTGLFGHPHTFIDVYPKVSVKDAKTDKISFKWQIDEMTSSMLIMEFDQDGDGKIGKKENFFIYSSYFVSLQDYNFYTDIKINNKIQLFPKPKNFQATIENNKICYAFDLDVNYDIRNLKFDFGDEDFYVAMILKKEFTKIKGALAKVSDLDMDFYFGYRLEFK